MFLFNAPAGGVGSRVTTGQARRDGSRAPSRAERPDGASRGREARSGSLRRRRATVVLLVLSVLFLGVSGGRATTVRKMTFSEVVDGAELIAIGTVSAMEETWDAERRMPYTRVTFSDVEVLKGTARGRELTLRFLGGRAPNGLTLAVSGMPRFAVKEQAVVFSAGNGLYACPLVGWWQGLYRVVFDAGRNALVVADHAWRRVVALDGVVGQREAMTASAVRAFAPDALRLADGLTLDEFKAAIAEELQ